MTLGALGDSVCSSGGGGGGSLGRTWRCKADLEDDVAPQEVSGSALWDLHIPRPSVLVGDLWKPIRVMRWRLPVASALVDANKETKFGPKGGTIESPKGCERGLSGAQTQGASHPFSQYPDCVTQTLLSRWFLVEISYKFWSQLGSTLSRSQRLPLAQFFERVPLEGSHWGYNHLRQHTPRLLLAQEESQEESVGIWLLLSQVPSPLNEPYSQVLISLHLHLFTLATNTTLRILFQYLSQQIKLWVHREIQFKSEISY